MIRYRTWHMFVLGGAFFLFACHAKHGKNSDEENNEPGTKETTADSLFKDLKQLQDTNSYWQKTYREKDATFSLDSFTYVSGYSNKFIYTAARLNKDFYKKYGSLLVYNADSSKFIDPFSYCLTMTIDKNGQLHRGGTEADQEVAVVDIKTHKRYRIFFCGTPCFVAKAIWINDDKIALLGVTTEEEDDNFVPTIWLVDMQKATTMEYSYNKQVKGISPDDLLDNMLRAKGLDK